MNMTTVDTSIASPSLSLASTEESISDGAEVAASAATPASASVALNIASLESMVSGVQSELATSNLEAGGVLEKVLTAVATVVGVLVSLVSSLVGKAKAMSDAVPERASVSTTAASSGSSSTASVPTASTASSTAQSAQAASSGAVGSSAPSASAAQPRSFFQVMQNDKGMVTVRSLDGYIVRAEGKDEAWTITGPDGKTTRIWGDPHVTESDGNRWDFKERGTFVFGNNKATIEVVPDKKGETLSSRLTLYSGDQRVTISGIDGNKPTITAVSQDGKQHDDALADGVVYQRKINQTGEAWTTKVGTKVSTMGGK
jgi:hypothetical protein